MIPVKGSNDVSDFSDGHSARLISSISIWCVSTCEQQRHFHVTRCKVYSTSCHIITSHRIMSPRLDTPKRHPSTSREFLPPNARCWTRRRRGRRPQPQLAMDSRHVYMSHFGKKSIYLCISCLIVSPLIVFLGKPHMIYVGFLSHVATPSLIHSF